VRKADITDEPVDTSVSNQNHNALLASSSSGRYCSINKQGTKMSTEEDNYIIFLLDYSLIEPQPPLGIIKLQNGPGLVVVATR